MEMVVRAFEGNRFTAAAARVNPNCDVTTISIRQHRNMLGEEDTVTSYLVNGTFADDVRDIGAIQKRNRSAG